MNPALEKHKLFLSSGARFIKMKRYQIAILFFALGIFTVTYFGVYLFKRLNDKILFDQPIPTPTKYETVKIFFSNTKKDPQSLYCDRTYPVNRAVSRLSDNQQSALGEYTYLAISKLLEGPTEDEKNNGYFTLINITTKVKNITIIEGVASIDFNDKLDEEVVHLAGVTAKQAGSCKVQARRSQITETLKQFPEIKEVVISVKGKSEGILQP